MGGSKVVSYHVYHSNNQDMNDKFLIADIVPDDFELPILNINSPDIAYIVESDDDYESPSIMAPSKNII